MDNETREYLEEIKELEVENNKLLKNLHARARIGFFLKFFYWLIVFGITIGAFYFVQPYIDEGVSMYKELKGLQQKIDSIPHSFSNYFAK